MEEKSKAAPLKKRDPKEWATQFKACSIRPCAISVLRQGTTLVVPQLAQNTLGFSR